jgi:endonuclease-3
VLGNAFGRLEGIAVDTHVFRLARRLGLAKSKSPTQVERELMQRVPRPEWMRLNHRLIDHGRAVCSARKPLCGQCVLAPDCPKLGVEA